LEKKKKKGKEEEMSTSVATSSRTTTAGLQQRYEHESNQRGSTSTQRVPISSTTTTRASLENNEEFKQKFKHVTLWLRELYKNQAQIPPFETNPQTIDMLYEISIKNQVADEQYLLSIKDMEVRTEEYKNESLY